jgi:phage gp46-like protein
MSYIRVRIAEGSQAQPVLLWDSVWSPWKGQADWAVADPDEKQNQGGLRSKAALHTAVILSLFTDKRIPDDHPLHYLVQDGDPRGWFGDGEDIQPDLGETDMGSLLWVFERAPLTAAIRKWVEAIALDALAPLIFQGVATRIEAQATAEYAVDRCDLAIQIYGRDGAQVYSYRFDDIWKQSITSPPAPNWPPMQPFRPKPAATLDPDQHSAAISLSPDGLTVTGATLAAGASGAIARSTTSYRTGKHYAEVVFPITRPGYDGIGIVSAGQSFDAFMGAPGQSSIGFYSDGWVAAAGGAFVRISDDIPAGTRVRMAVDFGTSNIWWAVGNGDWNGSPAADPATGIGGISFASIASSAPFFFGVDIEEMGNIATVALTRFVFPQPPGFTGW